MKNEIEIYIKKKLNFTSELLWIIIDPLFVILHSITPITVSYTTYYSRYCCDLTISCYNTE
jgi:hypothetical protein